MIDLGAFLLMIFSLNSLVSLFTKTVLDPGGLSLFFFFLLSDLEYKGVFCVIHFLSLFYAAKISTPLRPLTDVSSLPSLIGDFFAYVL